jgi:hypothetical protein
MKNSVLILMTFFYCEIFSQQFPVFKPLRYDEDYSYLKTDTTKNWYNKLKFSPLSKTRSSYISYGGEIRFQYFYSHNEGWGDELKDSDGYILSRFIAHADIHTSKHFRTFVQLQSSISVSRISPNPIDENPLEVHQAFFDINNDPAKTNRFILRIGRQELLYGSQRLVSVRDGPNNRQSFDALRSIVITGKYKIELFSGHFVAARRNIFDDGFNRNVKFWGAYIVRNKFPVIQNFDIYYLGLWKRNTVFDDGAGKERRHSIGTRLWNKKGNWQYDIEALYQFGKLAAKDIAAWTTSVNTSYKFNKAKLKPEIGIKTELISGDKKYGDVKLQTFNPLFPRGGYFGLAALIGPANLIDIHPSLSLNLSNKLDINVDYDIFWRFSRNDGLYAANVALIYSGKNEEETSIGRQLSASFIYRPNNFLYFRIELTWFDAGNYLRSVSPGKDIIFTGVTAQLKF